MIRTRASPRDASRSAESLVRQAPKNRLELRGHGLRVHGNRPLVFVVVVVVVVVATGPVCHFSFFFICKPPHYFFHLSCQVFRETKIKSGDDALAVPRSCSLLCGIKDPARQRVARIVVMTLLQNFLLLVATFFILVTHVQFLRRSTARAHVRRRPEVASRARDVQPRDAQRHLKTLFAAAAPHHGPKRTLVLWVRAAPLARSITL
jgi:hypothetical protein